MIGCILDWFFSCFFFLQIWHIKSTWGIICDLRRRLPTPFNCLIWVIASDYSQRDCLKGYFLFRPYSCPFEGRVYLLIFSVEREKSNLIHDLDTGFCWRSIIHANPFQCNHYLLMICNLLITMVKYGQAISVKINTTIFDVN